MPYPNPKTDRNVSDLVGYCVKMDDFRNMSKRVYLYRKHFGHNPPLVYIREGMKGDYVTYDHFENMDYRLTRWLSNPAKKGKVPGCIYTKKPVYESTPVIPEKMPEPLSDGNCFRSAQWAVWKQSMTTRLTCGPYATKQALVEWALNIPVAEIAAIEQTGIGNVGTNPANILNGVPKLTKKYGIPCKAYTKSFRSIGWKGVGQILADPNRTMIFHLAYKDIWGHYDTPVKNCLKEDLVWIAENLHGEVEVHPCDRIESWIRNTPGNQDSCIIFEKI